MIGKSNDQQRAIVLSVDALSKAPQLLARFNPGYHYATKFWSIVSSLVLVGGIALSFVWHWWIFLVGFVLSFALYRSNKKSVADFAVEALKNDANAAGYFASHGLVWEVREQSLVPESA